MPEAPKRLAHREEGKNMLWGRALAQGGGCRINIPEGRRWAISTLPETLVEPPSLGGWLNPRRMAEEFSRRPSVALLFMIGPAAFHPGQVGVSGSVYTTDNRGIAHRLIDLPPHSSTPAHHATRRQGGGGENISVVPHSDSANASDFLA